MPALGCIPDVVDGRDFPWLPKLTLLPSRSSNAAGLPPVEDQGPAGSCGGHMGAYGAYYCRWAQGLSLAPLSRLQIYYNARLLEGTQGVDAGCQIRDVVKGLAKFGAAPESDWPYDVAKLTEEPPPKARLVGFEDLAIAYHRLPSDLEAVRSCLADGNPVWAGIPVYESFEEAPGGAVPMPRDGEALLGYHAILWADYDTAGGGRISFPNSWGEGWGDAGWGYLPFPYVGLAKDLWTVTLVTPTNSQGLQQ